MTLQKINTFLKSLWFHVWSGFPKSTQEEINFRFKVCNQDCDMYNRRQYMFDVWMQCQQQKNFYE